MKSSAKLIKSASPSSPVKASKLLPLKLVINSLSEMISYFRWNDFYRNRRSQRLRNQSRLEVERLGRQVDFQVVEGEGEEVVRGVELLVVGEGFLAVVRLLVVDSLAVVDLVAPVVVVVKNKYNISILVYLHD